MLDESSELSAKTNLRNQTKNKLSYKIVVQEPANQRERERDYENAKESKFVC